MATPCPMMAGKLFLLVVLEIMVECDIVDVDFEVDDVVV